MHYREHCAQNGLQQNETIGYVQPTREKMIATRGNRTIYHSNAITTWAVSDKGEVKHVFA
jgi:sulfane dehydrogenase subunit SoxC